MLTNSRLTHLMTSLLANSTRKKPSDVEAMVYLMTSMDIKGPAYFTVVRLPPPLNKSLHSLEFRWMTDTLEMHN